MSKILMGAVLLLGGCTWPDAMGGGCMWPCNNGVPGRGEGLPSYAITGGGMTIYDNGWTVIQSGNMTIYNW